MTLRLNQAGEEAVLEVCDSGPGVPEAELSKLGQRLRRLDSSRTRSTGGTGLGLSIVTAIAGKHGGSVRYGRSSLGGLRVAVDLPACDGYSHEKACPLERFVAIANAAIEASCVSIKP